MSVVVLLDFRVHPDAVEKTKQLFKKLLPETRKFAGCEGVDVLTNVDEPANFVFHERWQSKEQYQKYFAWRTETGSMDAFGSLLAGAPTIRYFERQDI